jgi:hypothetical protein
MSSLSTSQRMRGRSSATSDIKGCVVGVATLLPLSYGKSIADHEEDGRWPIGWSVAKSLRYPTATLKLRELAVTQIIERNWGKLLSKPCQHRSPPVLLGRGWICGRLDKEVRP